MTHVREEAAALTTADIATAGKRPGPHTRAKDGEAVDAPAAEPRQERHDDEETLAPLFPPRAAADFRAQWDAIQISFVDDPRSAVRRGDELVAQVMKSLAETFAQERATLEKQLGRTEQASTEDLRVALRRYRSFFKRLLTL